MTQAPPPESGPPMTSLPPATYTGERSHLPSYKIVIMPGPLVGYGEAGSGHPPLACLRCGSLVVNVPRHDEWHATQERP